VLKTGAVACRVFFSLASQSYLESKKSADSLKLKEPQRQQLLELTIQDSKKSFKAIHGSGNNRAKISSQKR